MKWLEVGAISTTMEWVVAHSMEMGYVRVMMEGGSIKDGGINKLKNHLIIFPWIHSF